MKSIPFYFTLDVAPSVFSFSLKSTYKLATLKIIIQGDQDHFLAKEMAITLKPCISDPMLVKPKCVWQLYNSFKNFCKQTANNVNKFSKIVLFSNAFWLYQHGVRSAPFQSYSHFFRQKMVLVNLYIPWIHFQVGLIAWHCRLVWVCGLFLVFLHVCPPV